jgi:hypothetical protein
MGLTHVLQLCLFLLKKRPSVNTNAGTRGAVALRGHIMSNTDVEDLFSREVGHAVRGADVRVTVQEVPFVQDNRIAGDRNVKIIGQALQVVQMEYGTARESRFNMAMVWFLVLALVEFYLNMPCVLLLTEIWDYTVEFALAMVAMSSGFAKACFVLRLTLAYLTDPSTTVENQLGGLIRRRVARVALWALFIANEALLVYLPAAAPHLPSRDLFHYARTVLILYNFISLTLRLYCLLRPKRTHVVIAYVPHLVSAVLLEYSRGTSAEVVRSTLRQKCQRNACLPIPDEDAVRLHFGSEKVLEVLIERQDFFEEGVACLTRP